MDVVASVVRRVIAPAWAIWERSPYLKHYDRLKRTQYDSAETIQRRQLVKLKQVLVGAYEWTNFWQTRIKEANFDPYKMDSLDNIQHLPLLTKDNLRESCEAMISTRCNRRTLQSARTSGSTGIPVEVFYDEAILQFRRACTLRSDEWSGWRLGERIGAIWGNAAQDYEGTNWRGYLRNRLLTRVTYLDSLKMDEKSLNQFATAIQRLQPSLLYGHAHSLYMFAKYLDSVGGYRIRPRGIISAAMVLHDWERQFLEQIFQCSVTNRYGCEELGLIACECEEHRGLHVNSDAVYVEVIRANGTPALPGETGMIVVTDLTNNVMPIVRYQIGDMGQISDRLCSCGRGMQLIEKIAGRIADYILTPSGKMVSGISLTDHFNTQVEGVIQMQIVQEELDRIVLRIVKSESFGDTSLKQINDLVEKHFGAGVHYECQFVSRIEQEPSGKYRFCISRVKNPFEKAANVEEAPNGD